MQEQRRYERVGFFCELTMTILSSGKTVPVRSFDISLGGVGVCAEISLGRGALVQIGFRRKNASGQEVADPVLGKIAYCRADEDGNVFGVEFLEPIQAATHPALTRRLQDL
jgi:hypothetical protein